MIADRFGGSLSKLGIQLRREVVRELTDAGLSTRAIAPVFDVSRQMISKDLRANEVATELPPDAPLSVGESVSTSPEVVEPDGGEVAGEIEPTNTPGV